jgi:hypothetical protein
MYPIFANWLDGKLAEQHASMCSGEF